MENNNEFCGHLKAWSFFVGWINLVLWFGQAIYIIVCLWNTVIEKPENNQDDDVLELIVYGANLFVLTMTIIFCILLVFGLHKQRRGCVNAYLIYMRIFICISVFGLVRMIFMGLNFVILLIQIVYLVIMAGSYYVINSRYKLMQREYAAQFVNNQIYNQSLVAPQYAPPC